MTNFIVQCADVLWQRHSVSIPLGDFRTKLQRDNGAWSECLDIGLADGDEDISDGDGVGSSGIAIHDDYVTDRLPVWRPPYACVLRRAALINACAVPGDGSAYYTFRLLNSASDAVLATMTTAVTGMTAYTPREFTLSASPAVALTESVVLEIDDDHAPAPLRSLVLVIDYEPNAGG